MMKNLLKFSLISLGILSSINVAKSHMMANNNQFMNQNFNKENMMNGANNVMVPVHKHNNNCVHNNQFMQNNNNIAMGKQNNMANGMQIIPVQNNLFNNNCNNNLNKNVMFNGMNQVPMPNNFVNNNQAMNKNIMNGMNMVPINNNIMNNNNLIMMKKNQVLYNSASIQNMMNLNKQNLNGAQIANTNSNNIVNKNITEVQDWIRQYIKKDSPTANNNVSDQTLQHMKELLKPKLEQQLIKNYKNPGTDLSVNITNRNLFLAHISRGFEIFNNIIENGITGFKLPGLNNVGATCYMNATLQFFANNKQLMRDLFISAAYQFDNIVKRKDESDIFALEFVNLMAELINRAFPENTFETVNNPVAISPKTFKRILSAVNPLFAGVQANDSKDLMNCLSETIHNVLNIVNNNFSFNIAPNLSDQTNEQLVFNTFMDEYKNKFSSPIQRNTYSIIENAIRCLGCNTTKYNFQVMNFLEFPLRQVHDCVYGCNIPNQTVFNQINLDQCFSHYCKIERMTGDNQTWCNICNQLHDSLYQTKIHSLPDTLILNLNRGRGVIEPIPIYLQDVIDFGNYVQYGKDDSKCYLNRIIMHMGPSSMAGHFVCLSRNSINSPWIMYNDGMVNEASQDQVNAMLNNYCNGSMPYILSYKKISDNDLKNSLQTLCNEMSMLKANDTPLNKVNYKQKIINEIQCALNMQNMRDLDNIQYRNNMNMFNNMNMMNGMNMVNNMNMGMNMNMNMANGMNNNNMKFNNNMAMNNNFNNNIKFNNNVNNFNNNMNKVTNNGMNNNVQNNMNKFNNNQNKFNNGMNNMNNNFNNIQNNNMKPTSNVNINMTTNQLLMNIFTNRNARKHTLDFNWAMSQFSCANYTKYNLQALNYNDLYNYVNGLLQDTVNFIQNYSTSVNKDICLQFANAWNNVLSILKNKRTQGNNFNNLYLKVWNLTQENNTMNGNNSINILELFNIYVPKMKQQNMIIWNNNNVIKN